AALDQGVRDRRGGAAAGSARRHALQRRPARPGPAHLVDRRARRRLSDGLCCGRPRRRPLPVGRLAV
ncbi:MAG: hypothetical protein AVDCRST_MAG61-1317, partial [uncultured Friedmanniella sp.]